MQLSFCNLMKNRTFPKKTLPRVYFTSHFPFCSISIATTTADPGRRNMGRQKIHFPLPSPPTAPLAGNHIATQPQPGSWAWHYCAAAARGVEAAGRAHKIIMQIKLKPTVQFVVSLSTAGVLEAGTHCCPRLPTLPTHLVCPTFPPRHLLLQPQGTSLLTLKKYDCHPRNGHFKRFFTFP